MNKIFRKFGYLLCLILTGLSLTTGCQDDPSVKNVILFIGDGMGPQQVAFYNQYRRTITPEAEPNAFEQLLTDYPNGINDVYMIGPDGQSLTLVSDSAATATMIATGEFTIPQVIGVDREGNDLVTALEKAKELEKSTGLITDTRVTHATPAAFYAEEPHRKYENEIAEDFVQDLEVDVALGGGGRHWIPQETNFNEVEGCEEAPGGSSSRKDTRNLIQESKDLGYHFACTKGQLANLPETAETRILGIFARSGFTLHPERYQDSPTLPDLLTMTKKAVKVLEKNPKGFFLMVEGGQIDWAGHDNDAKQLFENMKEADQVLKYLLDYVKSHPDTLLIVTADHETGGMGFSYQYQETVESPSGVEGHEVTRYFADALTSYGLINSQTASYSKMIDGIYEEYYEEDGVMDDQELELGAQALYDNVHLYSEYEFELEDAKEVLDVPEQNGAPIGDVFFDGHDFHSFFVYEPWRNALAHQFASQNGIVWATGTHTSTPVQIFAAGPKKYADQVIGYHHHTDLGKLIFNALLNQ